MSAPTISAKRTSPAEACLREHLEGAAFQLGVCRGRWRLVSLDFPVALIAVAAAERAGAPSEYVLRFDFTDYPNSSPTALPWDIATKQQLAANRWPNGHKYVPAVFNPSRNALYLPTDRLALPGHDQWRAQHAHLIWTRTSEVTLYLAEVSRLLNSDDYTGVRNA